MKVLLFDLRESEKPFFERNSYLDFDITFREESLTDKLKLTEEELCDTVAISVYRSSILTDKILKQFKNLRVIATRSYGFSHIDLEYCMRNRIAVLNIEQYGEIAVAEYAMGLIIGLTRNIKRAVLDVLNYNVNPKKYEGTLLNHKTIGIIGCGKVGKKIAHIADLLGMKAYVSSYKDLPNFDSYCNVVPFDTLLRESDIIALHMPFTTESYQIIGKEEFNKMKNGVYIINTSSVELIDMQALLENLLSGKVRGAGLDILESDHNIGNVKDLGHETMSTQKNKNITEKLLTMKNVIITPHIAYNTIDSIDYVLETTMNNLRDFIKGIYTNRVC